MKIYQKTKKPKEDLRVPHQKNLNQLSLSHQITKKKTLLLQAIINQQILSMCLDDNASQIAQFKEVIQECPGLKVAIGHFGMVTGKCWEQQVKLAQAPNVYVETGGMTWLFNSEFYPYPSAVRSIREAADMVGMDKLMWGSDYPRTICAITYKMSYDFVLKTKELSQEDKEAFLGLNAKRFYGFGDVPELPYIKNMSE